MDPGIALVVSTAITATLGLVGVIVGAWVSIVKSEDRAALAQERETNKRLRKKVESLGGDPDED